MLSKRIDFTNNLPSRFRRFNHQQIGSRILAHIRNGRGNAAGDAFDRSPAHTSVLRADFQQAACFLALIEQLDGYGGQHDVATARL